MSDQRDQSGAAARDQRHKISRAQRWLAPARAFVHRWPGGRHIWRIGIAAVGLAVVIAGIVMLVTPGPGWLVIFIGFAIWATEFAWASSVTTVVRRSVARCASWLRRQPRWLWLAVGSVSLVAIGVVVLLAVQ